MSLDERGLLMAIGSGATIADIAEAAGVGVEEVRALWDRSAASRLPPANAHLIAAVGEKVEILRDSYGVPHIYAATEPDLFFGLGFAMAQDRLWLMDYLRRKATGRLAEILGPRYIDQDYLYRILDFSTVCARNYALLDERWQRLLYGMAEGINRAVAEAGDRLPIEFDVLGYRPDPWAPADLLVGLRYLWWGLSGRPEEITTATILDRVLGAEAEAFEKPERADVTIVPDGRNAAASPKGLTLLPPRDSLTAATPAQGSNNWVVSGQRTRSGKPLLANDPHYDFGEAHGNFYPCHLHGAGHKEAGFVFLGTPGMMTGVNDRIAWGYTNSATSVRDLYVEELDPGDPTRYRNGDAFVPLAHKRIAILVKGQAPVEKTIYATVRGPIVSEVIPKIGPDNPPISIRWVGFEMIEDVKALIELNLAEDWPSFRAALGAWAVSVANFSYGDVDDNIGYQLAGRIPVRPVAARGVRPASDPAHAWIGYVPFEGNPRMENPPNGVIASANNRPVSPRPGSPFYGAYAGGTRAARILQILSAKTELDATDFRRMQYDSKSLIAAEVVPRIVAALRGSGDAALREIAEILAMWDDAARVDSIAPTIFTGFMEAWTHAYAAATLPDEPTVRASAGRAARRALVGEEHRLSPADLDALIARTMESTTGDLRRWFGDDRTGWLWGRTHAYTWPHPLGDIGEIGRLLSGPTFPVAGTENTIDNLAPSFHHPFVAIAGPTYRLIADLSDTGVVLINSHCPTNANPASPHFSDTIRDFAQGNYQMLRRDRAIVEVEAEGMTILEPG